MTIEAEREEAEIGAPEFRGENIRKKGAISVPKAAEKLTSIMLKTCPLALPAEGPLVTLQWQD